MGISCHNITHTNGYYGAWPGWVVLASVYPNKRAQNQLAGEYRTVQLERRAEASLSSTLLLNV